MGNFSSLQVISTSRLTAGNRPLPDDGSSDVQDYNAELSQRSPLKWQQGPWLYLECYLYRRMATLFALSSHWRTYDVFERQKLSTFQSSRPAVIELASRYRDIMTQLSSQSSDLPDAEKTMAEQVLFSEMCEICLWGNATDLSLLTNLSYEDIQKLQGSKARKAAEKNILVNDLPAVFQHLKQTQQAKPNAKRRVDIVLDNAGFELFVDLILAGYLVRSGLATTVVLHPKNIPWFVSDVMPKDFLQLLNALRDPQAFYTGQTDEAHAAGVTAHAATPLAATEVENVKFLFDDWSRLHADGQLVLRPNAFWTAAGSYWRMPATHPDLYADLRCAELVVFKGDLNGRKLAGDCEWDAATPFAESLGPLAEKGKGLRVLELRTLKADVAVGLPQGKDDELRRTEGGGGEGGARKWAWTGKWAVVLFHDAA